MLNNNCDNEINNGNLSEDKAIAKLQEELDSREENIRTERLIWILALTVLLNAICFAKMESWSGPIVIGIIELLFLIVIADKLQIGIVSGIIDRVFNIFNKNDKE